MIPIFQEPITQICQQTKLRIRLMYSAKNLQIKRVENNTQTRNEK